MTKRINSKQWYQKKHWIIASLLLFPPLGIPLLWKTRWPRASKIGGSVLSGLILLTAITGEATEPTATQPSSPTAAITKTAQGSQPSTIATEPPPAYDHAIATATAATENVSSASTAADWSRIVRDWDRALDALAKIPQSSDYYAQSEVKVADYSRSYDYAVEQMEISQAAETAATEQSAAEQREAETQAIQVEAPPIQAAVVEMPAQGSYTSGTCKDLRAMGVGSNFTPGDANYTSSRDRDNDGVACES